MVMGRKQKLKKGEYGYIDLKRKTQPWMVLGYVLIGIAVFVLGLLLNKFERANIFTIVSFLFVLPAAKKLVNFVVFAPFHTIPLELKQKVEDVKKENDAVFYDVVFTSPQKVMFLSVLCVAGNEVIGLIGRKKESREEIEKYLKESIKKRGWAYKVTIVSGEKDFLKRVQAADRNLVREERSELMEYLTSLLVE